MIKQSVGSVVDKQYYHRPGFLFHRTTVREHNQAWETLSVPAKPSWLLHIAEILSILVECGLPVVDRAVIQGVFGLGRRQAIELMHRFGGYQAGRTFLIERNRLVGELDAIGSSDEYKQEMTRHEKLTTSVVKLQRERRAKEVRIEVSAEVFDNRMATLPESVHLEPGKLEIEFSGSQDLLAKLFALSQAAANDYDGFLNVSDGKR